MDKLNQYFYFKAAYSNLDFYLRIIKLVLNILASVKLNYETQLGFICSVSHNPYSPLPKSKAM